MAMNSSNDTAALPTAVADILQASREIVENGGWPCVDPQYLFDIADAEVDLLEVLPLRPVTALACLKKVAWGNDWGDFLAREIPQGWDAERVASAYAGYCRRHDGMLFTVSGSLLPGARCAITGEEGMCYQYLWLTFPDSEPAHGHHDGPSP